MPQTAPAESPTPAPARHHHWWDPAWNRATWILLAVFIIPVIGGMVWIMMAADGQSTVDPATQTLASQLARGPVQAFRGTEHTIYQATGALPSASSPQAEGLRTLVWMSGTNCGDCAKMDGFAWETLKGFGSEAVIVEKDLSRQPITARYGVTVTPSFVLLSPDGQVLARFAWQPTADALKAAVAEALGS